MTVHKLLFSSDDFYKNLLIIPVTTQEAVTALKGQHRQTNCLFKRPETPKQFHPFYGTFNKRTKY